jgi:transketolase
VKKFQRVVKACRLSGRRQAGKLAAPFNLLADRQVDRNKGRFTSDSDRTLAMTTIELKSPPVSGRTESDPAGPAALRRGAAAPEAALSPPANAIRFLSIDAIFRATEGHQGVPLGMAEIATALFTRHLKFNPLDPTWPDRDRFVLSNGHGSMLLFSLLYLAGYENITLDEIKRFRELGSRCEGHPEFDPAGGIEVTTGPLGQGIANAFGMAVAEAYLNARFGPGLVDHHTYAFVGDGCLQEGIGQEMISLAGHLRLGKLVLFWDDNRITDDGATSLSISEDVAARFRVADWDVVEVDGHDIEAVSGAIAHAKADPRPSLVACSTVIARGIARLQGQRGGHSGRLLPEDVEAARRSLDWPHPPFEVPAEILAAWRDAGRRSRNEYEAWQRRVAALPAAVRAEFERLIAGELPAGWREVLLDYKRRALDQDPAPGGIMIAADINDLLTDVLPERMVGCADLEAPTSHKRRLTAFTAGDRSGAYVHCGVREHVMGAMANGMAAHGGIIPLAVTYLAFSDYERPAMRMAALMGLPVKFVFSHDSIGVGEERPDASAGRDPRFAARDAEHAGLPPGRCRRGGRVLGGGVRSPRRPFDAGLRAPDAAARQARACRREPVAARRLRAGRGRGEAASGHAAGHRLGGGACRRGARTFAGRWHSHGGGVDAVLGAVRRAGRGISFAGAGSRQGARGRRGGAALRLGPLPRRGAAASSA